MSNPTTFINLLDSPLPTCIPNLMPFHVGYSGPASVSTFMHVENYNDYIQGGNATTPAGTSKDTEMEIDASSPLTSPPNTNSGLKTESSASSITDVESQTTSGSTAVGESQASGTPDTTVEQSTPPSLQDGPPVLEDADKRFLSTFRGRSIHGLTIELPFGYSGLVLRDEEKKSTARDVKEGPDTKAKDSTKTKILKSTGKAKAAATEQPVTRRRGRLTRSAAPKPIVITDDDEDDGAKEEVVSGPSTSSVEAPMEIVDDADQIPDQPEARKLVPQAQFTSFTLWHTDRPVDKGNDDYYRTLTEWISLSHEINRTDL